MGNNINDLKKIANTKPPLKINNKNIDKIKDEVILELEKKNDQNDKNANGLMAKNSPSEILGRSQVKNKKSSSSTIDNFENDMDILNKSPKAVHLANYMFEKALTKEHSYINSALLSNQFVKEFLVY